MRKLEYYEAFDGTVFNDMERCKEYEENLKEMITKEFKKLILREAEGYQITNGASAFPMAECGEEWWYGVIVMKNEEDYETVKKYAREVAHNETDKIKKIFNEEILVSIGEGNSKERYYNYFYWWGTITEAVANYTKALLTFGKGEKV